MNLRIIGLIVFLFFVFSNSLYAFQNDSTIDNEEQSERMEQILNIDSITLKKQVKKILRGIERIFGEKETSNIAVAGSAINLNNNIHIEDDIRHSTADSDPAGVLPTNMPSKTNKEREVFGFHPYWQEGNQEDYNYDLLTAVSYFACKLDPNSGEIKEEQLWKSSNLIDMARDKDKKVYLTITNFTESNNRKFLNNKSAQKTSLITIDNLLKERDANGVIIDFEDVPDNKRNDYTAYIILLSKYLNEVNRKVIVALPGNLTGAFDVKALNPFVEYFIIMGKNYYYNKSAHAGPVAPLNMGELWSGSLENSVKNYLEKGVPKNKLILSLPYYGSSWITEDNSIPSKNIKFVEHLSYKRIKEKYPGQPLYEPISQTAYLNIPDGKTNTQVWYDDALTLGKKYDFINNNDLAGVGIWALGYDDGYDELWTVLGEKFGVNASNEKTGKPIVLEEEESWMSIFKGFFYKNKNNLKGMSKLMAILLLLGFLFSLRNAEIRAIVFQETWIKNAILFGVPLLIFYITYSLNKGKNIVWATIILACILLGYGLYYLLVKTDQRIGKINRIP